MDNDKRYDRGSQLENAPCAAGKASGRCPQASENAHDEDRNDPVTQNLPPPRKLIPELKRGVRRTADRFLLLARRPDAGPQPRIVTTGRTPRRLPPRFETFAPRTTGTGPRRSRARLR